MPNGIKRAFTLIELLVVIAIIAILAGILFPVFAQARDSAKDTQNLMNCKQIGLGSMSYCADNDDYFMLAAYWAPGTAGSNAGLPWTWQQYIQPYVKNFDIMMDVKMPAPSSKPKNLREFQISQHYGVPVRAAAVYMGSNTVPTPYFITGPSWDGIVGFADPQVQFDGIFGIGISGAPGGYLGLRYTNADGENATPSLSAGGIENVSDQVLAAPSANYDMWFGNARVLGNRATYCNAGYGGCTDANNCAIAWPNSRNITGPHARKRPDAAGGNGSYMGGSCYYPNGMATFVAADGSAKSMNLRRVYEMRTPTGSTNRVFYRFWPQGGL